MTLSRDADMHPAPHHSATPAPRAGMRRNMKPTNPTRRDFVRGSIAVTGALAFPTLIPSRAFGANERVHVACIGAGGKGEVDVQGAEAGGGTIAFLCDVDEGRAGAMYKKYPSAKRYRDFRE